MKEETARINRGSEILTNPKPKRAGSARISGIRGEMVMDDNKLVAMRPSEPRKTGLRQETQHSKPKQSSQINSRSDSIEGSLTQLASPNPPWRHGSKESEDNSELVSMSPSSPSSSLQRAQLKTAVLSKGRLPLALVPSSSDTRLKQASSLPPTSDEASYDHNNTYSLQGQHNNMRHFHILIIIMWKGTLFNPVCMCNVHT